MGDVYGNKSDLIPWVNTGNEQRSPAPVSMPAAGDYNSRPGYPTNPGVATLNSVKTFESTLYQPFLSVPIFVPAGAGQLILSEPSAIRTYLEIRSAASSAGSLAIGLDQQPTGDDNADWIIAPGQRLPFWGAIPQNRLYALAIGGDVQLKLIWVNTSAPA